MSKCRQLKVAEVVQMTKDGCRGRTARRDRAFILFTSMVGYRCSEILSLRRNDVLDDDGRLLPEVTVSAKDMKKRGGGNRNQHHPPKKSSGRTVPIPDQANAILRAWLIEMEKMGWASPETHVFLNLETGKPLCRSAAWKIVRRASIRAGIPPNRVGVHSLRKSFAAETYDYLLSEVAAGKKIDVLRTMQRLLGHRRLESCIYYLSTLDDSHILRTVNEAAARFGRAAAMGA